MIEIKEPVLPVPVFLPPVMFDSAKALGIDMTNYRKTKLIPLRKEPRAYLAH